MHVLLRARKHTRAICKHVDEHMHKLQILTRHKDKETRANAFARPTLLYYNYTEMIRVIHLPVV